MRARASLRPTRAAAFAAAALVLIALGVQLRGPERGRMVWTAFRTETLALMLAPHDAPLRFAIGEYYFGGGAYDLRRAERAYRDALAIDPALPGAHYELARIYFLDGRFPLARAEADEELRLHPDFGRTYYVRGLINGYAGNLAEAEADFRAFLSWKPDSWAGNNDLAWVTFAQGNYAQAADAARRGLSLSPGNPWLLNALGVSLMNAGDRAGAKRAFAEAQAALATLDDSAWGAAYPGNDPLLYPSGLSSMRDSVAKNLALLADVHI